MKKKKKKKKTKKNEKMKKKTKKKMKKMKKKMNTMKKKGSFSLLSAIAGVKVRLHHGNRRTRKIHQFVQQ